MKFESINQLSIFQWVKSFFTIGIFVGLVEGIIKWSRMLLGAPDPMKVDILWTAAGFYGIFSALVGLGVGLFALLFIRQLKLSEKIGRWIPVVGLGLIVFWGSYNAITLILKSSIWALAILALGITYQTMLFLSNRKPGLVHFLASKSLISLGLVIVLAGGVYLYRYAASLWTLSKLPPPVPDAPNVLLITLDTLRADHMSTYGYQRDTTPNLSRFAAEGAQFEDAFSTASWTLPSHATIMTGLFTSEHLAEATTGWHLQDKFYTLAEAFSASGYQTGAVIANEFVCTENLGFGQGFDYFNGMFWNLADSLRWTSIGEGLFWKLESIPQIESLQLSRKKASDVNRYFLNWLQKRSDRPFFAWLNYFDPHDPYYAPAPFNTLYGSTQANGQPGSFGDLGASDWGGILTPDETEWQIDHYDDSIAYLDDQLGKLFEALRQAGLYDNTIIVITSDHGEAFGEHQLYGHANSLYREEIQVPLMIRYPKKVSPGEQIPGDTSLRDLAATITDLADLKTSQPFPGQSLFNSSREAAIAELYQNPYQPENHPAAHANLSSIITEKWQAIFTGDQAELFAHDDIGQRHNLAEQETDKSLLANLKKELENILTSGQLP